MCGIAGAFLSFSNASALTLVQNIVRSQFARGPDHQEIHVRREKDLTLILGHNRLNIIDLTSNANQPMWKNDPELGIVFNGEIYNYIELRDELIHLGHTFKTRSDTEVILESFKEWGMDAINRFNGMFAFALYDENRRRLWLVRDRFGVKPLYYILNGSSLFFASTCTTMAQHFNLDPNLDYVVRGIRKWVYEDDLETSPYFGLNSLRQGHCLEVSFEENGRLSVCDFQYYDLQKQIFLLQEQQAGKPASYLQENIQEILESSIRLRLRSDVPVGIALSGGLDSSTIAALVARERTNVVAFSFGSPSDRGSEGLLVDKLSKQLNIEIEFINPSLSELKSALDKTLAVQEAPFPGASVIAQYLVFERAKERGVKVLLGGQGGDELFLGYRKFQLFFLGHLLHHHKYLKSLREIASLVPTMVQELPHLSQFWEQRMRYRGKGMETIFNDVRTDDLDLNCKHDLPFWFRQLADVTKISLPTLLRYEDRNSMGHSVESRLPFLDFRLVEAALALPTALKLRNGVNKWVLRQVMKEHLPKEICFARYRSGFDVPQARWIKQGLGEHIRTKIKERGENKSGFIPTETEIDRLFSNQQFVQREATFGEAISTLWLESTTKEEFDA